VVDRIADRRRLLDPRTLRDEELDDVAAAVSAARLRLGVAGAG
jgi:hypothetical protein